MQVEWYGQSAFRLIGGDAKVFIDPIGRGRRILLPRHRIRFPPLGGVDADLVLITHEHADHNGLDAVAGSPQL
jgi:L-ascorbate metabolism protein UlaG (beta-lactamase superfamily)